MKQKLLFLLTALLLLTTGDAWGRVDMTTMTGLLGLTNNETPAWEYYSKTVTIKAGETYTYTFQNYTKGESATGEYQTWIAEIRENTSNYCLDARGDGGGWKWEPSTDNLTYNYVGAAWNDDGRLLSDFMTAYNDVTVTLTISCSNDGKDVTIVRTATLNGDTDFSGTWTCSGFEGNDKTINLIAEASHQVITNVHANTISAEKNYALLNVDHTASSSRNGSNVITTTVDAEFEHYNNTKAAAWGGWAYAQFSYTVPVGYSVESATLTWSTTIGGNTGTRNNDIYYVNAGTTIDYASLTSSTNLNPDATFIVQVQKAGPATHTGIATDVSSAVRTIAATQNYIIFKWTNNGAGADLHGKTSANPPTLELATTAETFYTATFNANDGALNPSVTVYTDAGRTSSIAKDALSANTTYYYTATLAGYNDYEGSFAVETSDPVVNFTMTSLPRYTFTVNAVNSVGSAVIEAIYTDDDSYDGKSHNVYFPKYLTGAGNVVTFSKDDDTYYQQYTSASGDATKSASYTAYDGVAYFFEGESFASLGTKMENGNYSNGKAGRGLDNGTMNVTTIPAAGNYDITYAVCSNNVGTGKETQFSFYRNNSGNVIVNVTNLNHSVSNVKTTGTQTVNDITFAAGDVLQFYAKETKIILDYVLIELKSVSATIGNTGWTTFASPYALDLSNMTTSTGEVKAYYASSLGEGNIVMTSTESEGVAAGTGLMLKGTVGATITIPVVASGEAISGNKLVGCTEATPLEANANFYVLINNGGNAEFQSLSANGATIPAGKAYLNIAASSARLAIRFDDFTGINSIEAADTEDGTLTDGKYLIGTKVVLVKNGVKYGTNGQKLN